MDPTRAPWPPNRTLMPAAARTVLSLPRDAGVVLVTSVFLALAALATAAIAQVEVPEVIRLVTIAVVYAPVAVFAVVRGHRALYLLVGTLSVSSGALAQALAVRVARPEVPSLEAATFVVGHIARIPDLAAVGLLVWLLDPVRTRVRTAGVALGSVALALAAATGGLELVGALPPGLATLPPAVAVASFTLGVGWLGTRWIHGTDRQRASWWSLAAGFTCLITSYPLTGTTVPLLRGLGDGLFVIGQAFLPLALLLATTPPPPSRRVIALVAAAQTLSLGVAGYLTVSAVVVAVGGDPLWAGAIAAGTLALLLGTTHRPLLDRATVLLAGRTPAPRDVLAALGAEATAEGYGVPDIAAALRRSLGAASVEIAIPGTGERSFVGGPAGQTHTIPLGAAPESPADLVVRVEHPETWEAIAPAIQQTTGLVAAAVQLSVVNEEVRAIRARTLEVRREERRLLHRELHDSLAPSLAGIAFGLSAADTLLTAGDPRWPQSLRELRAETAACTEDVRRLARALLPTALDQGDLDAALAELAATVPAGLRVETAARGTDVLDTDRHVRVYLLAVEAVQRARMADGVPSILITASAEPGCAVLRIDLPGASAEGAAAVARGMDRRAQELDARTSTGFPWEARFA